MNEGGTEGGTEEGKQGERQAQRTEEYLLALQLTFIVPNTPLPVMLPLALLIGERHTATGSLVYL